MLDPAPNTAALYSHVDPYSYYKTVKGKFGLGPAALQRGDEVVVLRPHLDGSGSLLIGETYVHDVCLLQGRCREWTIKGQTEGV